MTCLVVIAIPAGTTLGRGDEVSLMHAHGALTHARVTRANAIDAELACDTEITDPAAWRIDYIITAPSEAYPTPPREQFDFFGAFA